MSLYIQSDKRIKQESIGLPKVIEENNKNNSNMNFEYINKCVEEPTNKHSFQHGPVHRVQLNLFPCWRSLARDLRPNFLTFSHRLNPQV